MKHNRNSIRRVVIAIDLSGSSGRALYSGISEYAQGNCHWRMEMIPHAEVATEESVAQLLHAGVDGVITSENEAPFFKMLRQQKKIPLVIIGYPDKESQENVSFVRNDDVQIGRIAAKYLVSLGNFRSFSYLPSENRTYWSLLREKGFKSYLREQGLGDRLCNLPAETVRTSFPKWLRGLEKPVGILAAYDFAAAQLLMRCQETNVYVPQQVAVIGVDDDRLICDFTKPTLSSIHIDHEREGAVAAKMLDHMMKKQTGAQSQVLSSGAKIIERESTATLTPGAHLVNAALANIRANIRKPPTVRSVITHLHVSRRLADLRFVELTGATLSETILSERLEAVTRLLETTRMPIHSIATSCGFSNANHLANVFRRIKGISMTTYRHSLHKPNNLFQSAIARP